MNRVVFFIDGFNLFHALDQNPEYHKYKWLNLSNLAKQFLTSKDTLSEVYYFTALANWNSEKVNRHKQYINALRYVGVDIVYGKFKRKNLKCRAICKKIYTSFEEKQTDVNIAIYLLEQAIKDEYDTAVILSGDSDLIPAINAVKNSFPEKSIWVLIPIGRQADELKNRCDKNMRIKENHLKNSQFDYDIVKGEKIIASCPKKWRS